MITAAAQVGLCGMNPMVFLKTKDPMKRAAMQAIANAADELTRRRDRDRADYLAHEIIKRLAAAMKR